MEDGLTIALSPVQLTAVLSPHTVTEAEAFSNRLLGGLELALGTVELMGATALCLAPDPTVRADLGSRHDCRLWIQAGKPKQRAC